MWNAVLTWLTRQPWLAGLLERIFGSAERRAGADQANAAASARTAKTTSAMAKVDASPPSRTEAEKRLGDGDA